MTRKPAQDDTAVVETAPSIHPLPSEGGSYEFKAGELLPEGVPTPPDNVPAQAPAAAPSTEA